MDNKSTYSEFHSSAEELELLLNLLGNRLSTLLVGSEGNVGRSDESGLSLDGGSEDQVGEVGTGCKRVEISVRSRERWTGTKKRKSHRKP